MDRRIAAYLVAIAGQLAAGSAALAQERPSTPEFAPIVIDQSKFNTLVNSIARLPYVDIAPTMNLLGRYEEEAQRQALHKSKSDADKAKASPEPKDDNPK